MKPLGRLDSLDALRTVAMVWMTVFHFCYDLNWLGLMPRQQFLSDPFWTWQRTAIVSLFLFTAGMGQAVAWHTQRLGEVGWRQRFDRRFGRRWLQVAGCALLVSAGSALVFPATFIYFGVLHGLAAMLLVLRLTAGGGRWLWLAGAVAITLKYAAETLINTSANWQFFNEKWLNWLGFIGRKPATEDYVPLIPWLAAVWWGFAAGLWVLQHRPHWLSATGPVLRRLAVPGRWSLSYYLLHQPVLLGALMGIKALW